MQRISRREMLRRRDAANQRQRLDAFRQISRAHGSRRAAMRNADDAKAREAQLIGGIGDISREARQSATGLPIRCAATGAIHREQAQPCPLRNGFVGMAGRSSLTADEGEYRLSLRIAPFGKCQPPIIRKRQVKQAQDMPFAEAS